MTEWIFFAFLCGLYLGAWHEERRQLKLRPEWCWDCFADGWHAATDTSADWVEGLGTRENEVTVNTETALAGRQYIADSIRALEPPLPVPEDKP